nr:unnamed protein product [Haemonchus contortus]
MFMRNGLVPNDPFKLNGTNLSEALADMCIWSESQHDERPSYGAEQKETCGGGAFKNIDGTVKKSKIIRLRAYPFNTAVLPALIYASEAWTLRKQDEH